MGLAKLHVKKERMLVSPSDTRIPLTICPCRFVQKSMCNKRHVQTNSSVMVELEIVLESQDFSGSRFRGFHMAQKTVLSKPLKWLLLRKPLKWPLPKPKYYY